ncbi:unnamed protein product [Linum trigynum]|uniref:Uncharacterized protein n=1 Tax=Linum trigynum TaxID=586398 RepID=A0AAV2E765_9ROSI
MTVNAVAAANDWDAPDTITFRLMNESYSLSFTEFSLRGGLYSNDYVTMEEYKTLPLEDPKTDIGVAAIWEEIAPSNTDTSNPTISNASDMVFHIRYIHHILAYSFCDRGNAHGVVTLRDIFYLDSMLHQMVFGSIPVSGEVHRAHQESESTRPLPSSTN